MLEKYTFLREELQNREKLVIKASHYSIQQEFVIGELRGFIENMIKTDPMEGRKARRRKRYKESSIHNPYGKTCIDRMLIDTKSKNPMEKFDLQTSMVNDKKTESEEEEDNQQAKLMEELDHLRRKVIHLEADLKAF